MRESPAVSGPFRPLMVVFPILTKGGQGRLYYCLVMYVAVTNHKKADGVSDSFSRGS